MVKSISALTNSEVYVGHLLEYLTYLNFDSYFNIFKNKTSQSYSKLTKHSQDKVWNKTSQNIQMAQISSDSSIQFNIDGHIIERVKFVWLCCNMRSITLLILLFARNISLFRTTLTHLVKSAKSILVTVPWVPEFYTLPIQTAGRRQNERSFCVRLDGERVALWHPGYSYC